MKRSPGLVPPAKEGAPSATPKEGSLPSGERPTLDVTPVSKGRRLLLFLADVIIVFFSAWLLTSALTIPIGRAIAHYSERRSEAVTAEENRDQILIENKVLFRKNDEDGFKKALHHTFLQYARYLVFPGDAEYADCDVFWNYYVDIRNDETSYGDSFKNGDPDGVFFDEILTDQHAALKNEHKTEFLSCFKEPDNDPMQNPTFKAFEGVFLGLYDDVIVDIRKNDLTLISDSVTLSFKTCEQTITAFELLTDHLSLASSLLGYVLSWGIYALVVPLTNHNGKTVAMMMLHFERVGMNSIYVLKKGETALFGIYRFIGGMFCLPLLPLAYVPLTMTVHIAPLLISSLLSVLVLVISLFVLLFNRYDRTLFDVLSRTVIIKTDALDEICRTKGYPG